MYLGESQVVLWSDLTLSLPCLAATPPQIPYHQSPLNSFDPSVSVCLCQPFYLSQSSTQPCSIDRRLANQYKALTYLDSLPERSNLSFCFSHEDTGKKEKESPSRSHLYHFHFWRITLTSLVFINWVLGIISFSWVRGFRYLLVFHGWEF